MAWQRAAYLLLAVWQLQPPSVLGIELRRHSYKNDHSRMNASCKETFFDEQVIDHFSFSRPSPDKQFWSQRYFICDEHWKGPQHAAPIFFYCGNEAPVDIYVTHTGLMWENAKEFGALLIFAEASHIPRAWFKGTQSFKDYVVCNLIWGCAASAVSISVSLKRITAVLYLQLGQNSQKLLA
jgi:Serine carboxypeptidase S28